MTLPPVDDTLSARVSPDCPEETKQILYHAWARDLSGIKPLLDTPGNASFQDPNTGETPLHAVIRSCGAAEPRSDSDDGAAADDEVDGCVEEAISVMQELFFCGAIWNDVDNRNETPGCVARRLGRKELYRLCVEAGVRAEMLFGLLDGYEELSSTGGEDDDNDNDLDIIEGAEVGEAAVVVGREGEIDGLDNGDEAPDLVVVEGGDGEPELETEPASERESERRFQPPQLETGKEINGEEYLRSTLTYSEGKLVDDDGNGVMMAWETEIMRRSVDALLPDLPAGKRVLNIGFGMGIIDAMLADTKPSVHHIVEAHPGVLEHLSKPDSRFGSAWEGSGPQGGAFKVHGGRWQDVLPGLLAKGAMYDAIYFDTFGEDYSQLKLFFTEFVPGLLDFEGRFGFFNGLGADRAICYDVYTKVAEMHLCDAGLDVDWEIIKVDMEGLEEAGKGEWEGVRRRYWTLDEYRLPICTFMG